MTSRGNGSLHMLGDRGRTVDGAANDVRGRKVKDSHGDHIGTVADLVLDDREDTVRFLLVEHGGFVGFGEKRSLVPVDAITEITEDEVLVDQSRDRVAAAPGYQPDLIADRAHQASVYHHYGRTPYWEPRYTYPANLGVLSLSASRTRG